MNRSTLDDAASDRALQQKLARLREERLGRFPPEVRLWLALVPAWTDRLAVACEFPLSGYYSVYSNLVSVDEGRARTFAFEAQKAGLCAVAETPAVDGPDVFRFWATDDARAEILRDVRGLYTQSDDAANRAGRGTLQGLAAHIGRQILSASAEAAAGEVSPLNSCWAALAALTTKGPNASSEHLIETVRGLVKEGDTGRAQTWLEAGKLLAQALGGPLESAVRLSENLIEREYRRVQDERHLKNFKPIAGQVEAFRRLTRAAGESADAGAPWALHYVGRGGVGKTMLLRYITGRLLAEDPERPTPFSRIDFDYLSPDYPVRRPGQLLLELAAGLRAQISTATQEEFYGEFQRRALELHETLSNEPAPDQPLANIRHPKFAQMLTPFNDLLRVLPQPVVLILDTCEELAKVRSAAGVMPTVEATFEILERVHDEVPSVRVIFAGRRLLAKAGAGWEVCPGELSDERAGLPGRKSFLLLHEIRGFAAREADEYLSENEQLQLGAEMRAAVLANSRDDGRVARIHHRPPRPAAGAEHFNPFHLSLYAHWIKEAPALTAADIQSGKVDPYVEMRIVNRVAEDVRREALPAAVLLRRFDKDMLAPALSAPARLEEIYRRLSGYEWINYQWDEQLKANFLEVDRNLHARLLEYFERSSEAHRLEAIRSRLAPGLAQLVRRLDIRQLTVDHLDAALRLLPAEDAAPVWADFERRAADQAAWARAHRVTERLLGEDGAVSRREHPLRAHVLATHAAALLHLLPDTPLETVWREVADAADQHPAPDLRLWLKRRALAGDIACPNSANDPTYLSKIGDLSSELKRFLNETQLALMYRYGNPASREEVEPGRAGHWRREQLFASFCSAFENVVEAIESDTRPHLRNHRPTLFYVYKGHDLIHNRHFPPAPVAFVKSLTGRIDVMRGNAPDAVSALDVAASEASKRVTDEPGRARWLDWRAPASLVDRLRLESLRLFPFDPVNWSLADNWQREAAGRLDNVDSERLVSLIIRRRLAFGLVPREELEALAAAEKYDAKRQPWRAAHRAAPPLACSLALGWLALGDAERALEYISRRIHEAAATRADRATVRDAESVKLQIIRRMRVPRRGTDLVNRLARSDDPRDMLAVRELIALNGSLSLDALLQPNEKSSAVALHAWWRSRHALTHEAAAAALERMSEIAGPRVRALAGDAQKLDADTLQLMFDWREAALVAERFKLRSLLAPVKFWLDDYQWMLDHPAQAEEALRLMLRNYALFDTSGVPEEVIRRFGPRRVAEAALEEGELLALRLPGTPAEALLVLAKKYFAEAGDPAGETIAGIRLCLARLHNYDEPRHESFSPNRTIPEAYERLRRGDTSLPRWADLLEIRDRPAPNNVVALNHPSWAGWLHRLMRALVELGTQPQPERLAARARALLDFPFGPRLPVELALSHEELTELDMAEGRVPPLLNLFLQRLMKAAVFGLVVIPLLIFAVAAADDIYNSRVPLSVELFLRLLAGPAAAAVYFRWVRKSFTVPLFMAYVAGLLFCSALLISLGIGGGFIVFGVLLLLLAIIVLSAGRWLVSSFAGIVELLGSQLTLKVEAADEGGRAGEAFDKRYFLMTLERVYPPPGWPLSTSRKTKRHDCEGSISGLPPYREAASSMPLEVSDELLRLRRLIMNSRLLRRFLALPVALKVDASLAHYPWEAVLSLASAPDEQPDGEDDPLPPFHFLRADETTAGKRSGEDIKSVYVVASGTWTGMAVNSWPFVAIGPHKAEIKTVPPPAGENVLRAGGGIVHLVGTPVRVASGLRLRVSEGAARASRRRAAAPPEGGADSPPPEDEAHVGTENLAPEEATLVVVQAEPLEFSPRLQTQREQTALLRAFAADVFAAGAPAVVVVPALPNPIGTMVVSRLARAISKYATRELTHGMLMRAADDMQMMVLRYLLPETSGQAALAEAAVELALDICVFWRGRVFSRGTDGDGGRLPPKE